MISGSETSVLTHDGCRDGTVVELWTVEGAGHQIPLPEDFANTLWGWLSDHAAG